MKLRGRKINVRATDVRASLTRAYIRVRGTNLVLLVSWRKRGRRRGDLIGDLQVEMFV